MRSGYLRITGRSKDVIIRGGENIPVVEIETLLYKHPAIALAASWPTPMSAWASAPAPWWCPPRPQPGPGLPGRVPQGPARGPAVHPRAPGAAPELPATPSGKIQKFRLRELLRNGEL
jgi:cyclohexanecarboxylate-CoA ligase